MGKLYIVATPIGNLEDITFRAIKVLKESNLVLAEDTRQSSKLFKHYEINTSLKSFHQNNEHKVVKHLVEELNSSDKIFSLISDAGMPAISDPGFLIVRECIKEGVEVEVLPGPTAFVNALVESGLPCTSFCFEGFLPHQKGRTKKLKMLQQEERTMVFYESPHRLEKTLTQFIEYFGEEREASVSRELTKLYAQTIRGDLKFLLNHFQENDIKGEFVIVVAGKK
jgi:16S rRNA (cytidine1402-2'-O)-methyltransferase